MNAKTLFAAAAMATLFAHGAAFAQEATPDNWTEIVSTVSRDAVHADTVAAFQSGRIETGEATRFDADVGSTLTREQVRAEAIEAHRLGLVDTGEVSAAAATPAQAEAIRRAGLRATSIPLAASSN